MIRIFTTLALFSLVMMIAALVLGLYLGDIHGVNDPDTLRWAMVHRLLGMGAALAVVLVDSIVVTYFIGTSRWCKEVVETYKLEPELLARSVTLKRRTFPWALISMLVVICVGALGAAADPMSGRAGTEHWVNIHLAGALAGVCFIAVSFYLQGQNIAAHHTVINDIVAEVRRIRQERGLEV
jgi:MFS family permease